jgi:hypothetical protein
VAFTPNLLCDYVSIDPHSVVLFHWNPYVCCRPKTSSDVLHGLKAAAATSALWTLAAVQGLKSCAAYCLIFWTPVVISDLLGPSSKPLSAILLTSIPYAFAAAAAVGMGQLSHKYVSGFLLRYKEFTVNLTMQ